MTIKGALYANGDWSFFPKVWKEHFEAMSRQALDLATAEHLEIVAIPAAVDLLDTLQRFGDLDIDDDAEDKLGIIIQALKQAAGRLILRTGGSDEQSGK